MNARVIPLTNAPLTDTDRIALLLIGGPYIEVGPHGKPGHGAMFYDDGDGLPARSRGEDGDDGETIPRWHVVITGVDGERSFWFHEPMKALDWLLKVAVVWKEIA